MMLKGSLRCGDIVWTTFDPSLGHEYRAKRPAIVVQSDPQIAKSNLVTIIPLTSRTGNVMVDDVVVFATPENRLRSDSVAKVYCICSFDYCRFDKVIGHVSESVMGTIKEYLGRHFGIT